MSENTHYEAIHPNIVFQERRFCSHGEVFECSGPYLVTGYLEFDPARMTLAGKKLPSTPGQRRFLWLLPPWAIFRYRAEHLRMRSQVHIFRTEASSNLCGTVAPMLAPVAKHMALPRTPQALDAWLSQFSRTTPCYQEADFSWMTRNLKLAIEAHSRETKSISDLAQLLGFNPTVMGRHFKRDLGLTPKQYQTRLRIIDSIDQMLKGLTPTDAGFLAGFNDLSRFYKQFKQTTHHAPGQYIAESKNAKTSKVGLLHS